MPSDCTGQAVFVAEAGFDYGPPQESAVFSARWKAAEWLDGRGPDWHEDREYDWTNVDRYVVDQEAADADE